MRDLIDHFRYGNGNSFHSRIELIFS
ncbi:hypothetical protein PSJ72_00920 [Escherichia coli]|nr:hypothetical protein [Escherichia coli]